MPIVSIKAAPWVRRPPWVPSVRRASRVRPSREEKEDHSYPFGSRDEVMFIWWAARPHQSLIAFEIRHRGSSNA